MSKTLITRVLPIARASALACAVACSSAGNAARDTADGSGGAPGPTRSVTDAGTDATELLSYSRIDDMEGTTGHIEWTPPVGVGGEWLTTTDSAQYGSISPVGCEPRTCKLSMWSYAPVPTPYETFPGITSLRAARLRTTQPLLNAWGASMSAVFARQADAGLGSGVPPLPVDLRQYKGVTFWAMAAQDQDSATILFSLEDKNTVPAGGVCVDSEGGTANCFNGFGATLTLTGTFKQYTIYFSDLAQDPGWGFRPAPDVLDPQQVYVLTFNVLSRGLSSLTFDVWIDDLYFVNK